MMSGTSFDLVSQAVALRRLGYIPLPVRPGGKHLDLAVMGYPPVHFKTRRKTLKELAFTALCFHLSQKPPTETDIAAWFAGFTGNIGILGGFNGLLVLDFHHETHFEQWERRHADLMYETPVARSPRGYHVYIKSPVPMITSAMYAGFRRVGHIKSLGGYVVTCPSVLGDDENYQWLPGRSPFEVSLSSIDSLEAVRLRAASPLKTGYDRIRNRGFFDIQ